MLRAVGPSSRPTGRRHHEHAGRTFIDIAHFEGDPGPGFDTFATLGVFYSPLMDGDRETGLRVKFIDACREAWPEFAGASFGVIAGERYVHPGRMLPGLLLAADLRDLALVLSRVATDSGRRTSLDDVIAAYGHTRESLAEDD